MQKSRAELVRSEPSWHIAGGGCRHAGACCVEVAGCSLRHNAVWRPPSRFLRGAMQSCRTAPMQLQEFESRWVQLARAARTTAGQGAGQLGCFCAFSWFNSQLRAPRVPAMAQLLATEWRMAKPELQTTELDNLIGVPLRLPVKIRPQDPLLVNQCAHVACLRGWSVRACSCTRARVLAHGPFMFASSFADGGVLPRGDCVRIGAQPHASKFLDA